MSLHVHLSHFAPHELLYMHLVWSSKERSTRRSTKKGEAQHVKVLTLTPNFITCLVILHKVWDVFWGKMRRGACVIFLAPVCLSVCIWLCEAWKWFSNYKGSKECMEKLQIHFGGSKLRYFYIYVKCIWCNSQWRKLWSPDLVILLTLNAETCV